MNLSPQLLEKRSKTMVTQRDYLLRAYREGRLNYALVLEKNYLLVVVQLRV